MSKIYEEFDDLVEAVLTNPEDQAALASLAEWFSIYNNYDWGGEVFNIDGSYGLRVTRHEDGTETYELVNFDDL